MNAQTAKAVEFHALAICAWTLVDSRQPETADRTAIRVDTARQCTQVAMEYSDNHVIDISCVREQIEAACRDAETEHAVAIHASVITILTDG